MTVLKRVLYRMAHIAANLNFASDFLSRPKGHFNDKTETTRAITHNVNAIELTLEEKKKSMRFTSRKDGATQEANIHFN
jgi:hypothetical protein